MKSSSEQSASTDSRAERQESAPKKKSVWRMMALGWRIVATTVGLLFIAIAIPSVIDAMILFAEIHADGVESQEVLFLNSTEHSHTLLVDGRLTVNVKDQEQQREHLERIKELFTDPDERAQVLQWGRKLFATCRDQYLVVFEWAEKQPRVEAEEVNFGVSAKGGKLTFDKSFDPGRYFLMHSKKLAALRDMKISDELAAHCAWRRLLACPGSQAEDLSRLKALVEKAVPDEGQRKKLIQWTKKRREQLHTVRQLKAVPEQPKGRRFEVRPPAPDTDWFDHWILYQDWCVTDKMFSERKEMLLEALGGPKHAVYDTWKTLLAFGAAVNEQRTGANALPQMGDQTLVVAAVDRLSGLDPSHSPRLAASAKRVLETDKIIGGPRDAWGLATVWDIGKQSRSNRAMPTEDYFIGWKGARWSANVPPPYQIEYLAAENSATDPNPITSTVAWMFLFTIVILWLAQYGLRFLTIVVFGLLLGLRKNPQWTAIRHAESRLQYVSLALAAVVIAITWFLTLYSLSPLNALFCSDVWLVLYAVLNAAMVGGIFMEAFKNVCTMIVVRLGFDAAKVWYDELVSAAFTVLILLHFETSWIGIAAALAIGLVSPWTAEKIANFLRREKVQMQLS